jgi:uncharacterized protein (DUF433 family)
LYSPFIRLIEINPYTGYIYCIGLNMIAPSFTPRQAASLTGLSIKAVNKAIEDRAIPWKAIKDGNDRKRCVSYLGLLCLELQADGLIKLPLNIRKDVFRRVIERHRQRHIRYESALLIDLYGSRKKMLSQLMKFRKASRMIVSDPEIMRGAPVFRGTRVPVYAIAEMADQGVPSAEILESYPTLREEMLQMATLYANAHPKRGRPAGRPWARRKPVRRVVRPLPKGTADAVPR